MNVGVHVFDKNVNKVVEYCERIGVNHICLACSSITGYDEQGYPKLDSLRAFMNTLEDADISVPTMVISRWPSPDVLLGKPSGSEEFMNLCKTLEVLGEASVGSILIYPNLDRPMDRSEEAECWKLLLSVYQRLVDYAEKAGVRIGNHAYYHPWKLVRNVETLMRLITEVPSPYNGITYCPGLYQSGDNVYEAVTLFGKKIFFTHARDIRRPKSGPYQFEEVFLGEGEVDLPKVVKLLQAVDYQGIICPEHLGASSVEGEDLEAQAVAYLKKLLASS